MRGWDDDGFEDYEDDRSGFAEPGGRSALTGRVPHQSSEPAVSDMQGTEPPHTERSHARLSVR